jgi:hypothetical protein
LGGGRRVCTISWGNRNGMVLALVLIVYVFDWELIRFVFIVIVELHECDCGRNVHDCASHVRGNCFS